MHATRQPWLFWPISAALVLASCATNDAPLAARSVHEPIPDPMHDPVVTPPPAQTPEWGTGDAQSHVVPALEILGFEFLLNQVDRHTAADDEEYESDFATFEDNLQSGWVIDNDPFGVNQLGHPYSGAIYHNFARSTGNDYWVSLAYTFVGSLLWETAGETTRPSLNDQITTGIGGTFLGEALFRSASRILEDPEVTTAGEVGAVLLSPPLAFNRLAFDRFDGIYPGRGPTVVSHASLGARSNTFVADRNRSISDERTDAAAEYSIEYGLPGKERYEYGRPFDYFRFEIAGLTDSDNHFAHVRTRGLLAGSSYAGESITGVHGLYGIYDYLSPGIFRVATTALGYGTTAQVRLSDGLTLHGTALLGAGFGAAGTVADDLEDRDYHYGGIPQAVLDWRLVFADAVTIESAVRDYLVIGTGSDSEYGTENILQTDLAVTLRVIGAHALRVQYVVSVRDTHYAETADEGQSIGTLCFGYAFLGR
jgi:hypothetical protein